MCAMWCGKSDDSVVVMKSCPEKAGDGVEDKNGMTCSMICKDRRRCQKRRRLRRDEACVNKTEHSVLAEGEHEDNDVVVTANVEILDG